MILGEFGSLFIIMIHACNYISCQLICALETFVCTTQVGRYAIQWFKSVCISSLWQIDSMPPVSSDTVYTHA